MKYVKLVKYILPTNSYIKQLLIIIPLADDQH